MKNLLLKWFPGYFNICAHYYVDFKRFPRDSKKVNVLIMEAGTYSVPESLGITPLRAEELTKISKMAYLKHDQKVALAVEEIANQSNHQNELVYVTYVITRHHLKTAYPVVAYHVPDVD